MASRVREVLERCEATVCAPVIVYGMLCEYPVSPAGERGPVVARPEDMAARLLRTIDGIGGNWTLTGEETFGHRAYGLPAICIESLAGGFREQRHLAVAGAGIEIRL
jgi:hypothetical protein